MTVIHDKKHILIKCPFGCKQEIHYGAFIMGKHICGGEFDSKTKIELRECFDRFALEVNEIFKQFKLRKELLN